MLTNQKITLIFRLNIWNVFYVGKMWNEWIIVVNTREKLSFFQSKTCRLLFSVRYEAPQEWKNTFWCFNVKTFFFCESIKLLKSISSPEKILNFIIFCLPITKAYHFSVIFLLYQQQNSIPCFFSPFLSFSILLARSNFLSEIYLFNFFFLKLFKKKYIKLIEPKIS